MGVYLEAMALETKATSSGMRNAVHVKSTKEQLERSEVEETGIGDPAQSAVQRALRCADA